MKKGSTLFLRAVLVIMGLILLALCIFAFPHVGPGMAAEFPSVSYLKYAFLTPYAAALPFFFAIYQSWKLLNLIDKNRAFSELAVKSLRAIKYSGVAMALVFFASYPFAFAIADADDAPGLVVMWLLVIGAPLVVSVFAALLEKLLQSAIDIKSENDLVV
jgi:hypothetical protein